MPNCKIDFSILSQAHNSQESIKNQKRLNNNLFIAYSTSVTEKAIRSAFKQLIQVIDNNSNFNSNFDNNAKFVNVNLSCNKLSISLLANNTIFYIKKKCVFKIKEEVYESCKIKATQKKKISTKQISKKSLKVSVLIFSPIDKFLPNIQILFINTNIVILVLYLF